MADRTHQAWLEEHSRMIADELNVKEVQITQEADQYITYNILPDLKRLGPRLGKRLPAVKKFLGSADGGQLLQELQSAGHITLTLPDGTVELDSDDIQVRLQAKEGWAAAQGKNVVVVLATELTEELIREGLARELVRTIQDRRKEMGCEFTDRIVVGIETESAALKAVVEQFADYIRGETLATEVTTAGVDGAESVQTAIGDEPIRLFVKIA